MAEELEYNELIEDFKKTGQFPLLWQWTAREFVCAANIIRAKREGRGTPALSSSDSLWELIGPMMLLYGLALENLLKGLLVARGVDATSTGELSQRLKTHNVLALWRQTDLPLDDQTEETLRHLHWSIEAGKYPVGTKPDADAPTPVWVALTSVDHIGHLLETVENALRREQPYRTFEKT